MPQPIPLPLLWELLAWSLPENGWLPNLLQLLAKGDWDMASHFADTPSQRTLARRVTDLAEAARQHLSDKGESERDKLLNEDIRRVTNGKRRNGLRNRLLCLDQSDCYVSGRPRFHPMALPGIWSLRFILVAYSSPKTDSLLALREKQAQALMGRRFGFSAIEEVAERRVLAMMTNLRTGSFAVDLLPYRAGYDPDAVEVDPTYLDQRYVNDFLSLIAGHLRRRGGRLLLPRRLTANSPSMRARVEQWSSDIGLHLRVDEDMPCIWPTASLSSVRGTPARETQFAGERLLLNGTLHPPPTTCTVQIGSPDDAAQKRYMVVTEETDILRVPEGTILLAAAEDLPPSQIPRLHCAGPLPVIRGRPRPLWRV